MSKKVKTTNNLAKDVKPKVPNLQAQLQFIDNCIAVAPLGRVQHIQAQQALQEIGNALKQLN